MMLSNPQVLLYVEHPALTLTDNPPDSVHMLSNHLSDTSLIFQIGTQSTQ